MIKSKLEKFIVKRQLILSVIMSILVTMFINHKLFVILGLIIGAFLALMRFSSMSFTYSRLLLNQGREISAAGCIIKYITSMIMLITVLAAAIVWSIPVFAGMIAGILQIPLIIMINSITEFSGLTHNNYQ